MKLLKNKKGFSLTELIVVSFIFGGLILTSSTILYFVKNESKIITDKIIAHQEEELLTKFIYKYISLGNIGISYGILNIKDDNNKNFLDFYPDYHSSNLDDNAKKRTFTLTNGKQILFLSTEESFKRINILDLYTYVVTTLLKGESRTATYDYTRLKTVLGSDWRLNSLFLFYVPIYLRKNNNMIHFPKIPAFIAYAKNLHPGAIKYTKLNQNNRNYFSFLNPTPGATQSYSDFTNFLAKSNLISGHDVLFGGLVNLLIFQMDDNKLYQCLIKDEVSSLNCNLQNTQSVLLAENIKEIKFVRNDVATTYIQVSFSFLSDQDGEN